LSPAGTYSRVTSRVPTREASALHGSSVGKLYGAIDRAYESATRDYATSELTALLEKAVQMHQPPLVKGRRIKLRYAHQGGMNPPRIIIHGNQVEKVPSVYQRYLTNFFQCYLATAQIPPRICQFKAKNGEFQGVSERLQIIYVKYLASFIRKKSTLHFF